MSNNNNCILNVFSSSECQVLNTEFDGLDSAVDKFIPKLEQICIFRSHSSEMLESDEESRGEESEAHLHFWDYSRYFFVLFCWLGLII